MARLVCLMAWLLAATCPAAPALGHLRAAPKPVFRKGHTLPRLTRWGWSLPFDVRVELTEHWGYAIELGEATAGLVKQLDDPASVPARLCALTASDPKRYPLSVLVHRTCGDKAFAAGLPPETWCQDEEGRRVWSPEAPDTVFRQAAARSIEYLRQVQEKAPIAILLNGGEYGLSVEGHHARVWEKDPRVMKARGDDSWFDYISRCKTRQESIITAAIRAAMPKRDLYIFYYCDSSPHRNRYGGWHRWAWDYAAFKDNSDLPSSSSYYNHYNTGWTGSSDLLTQTLNSITRQIALGRPLSYNWVCSGWTRPKLGERAFSPHDRYMGYLKCYYTAGMIGGVAGYFSYPKGGFTGGQGEEMPHWLYQMVVLARAHALFSHLEAYLREGDLLPGPLKHRWSKEFGACELPTGDGTARVVARKRRDRDDWLITAWAAGGDEREVQVEVPKLGTVRLLARPAGSVYRATVRDGKPALVLVDPDAMRPTAAFGKPTP